MTNNGLTYESTIVKNGVLCGQWHQKSEDGDTHCIISILRHKAICNENEIPSLKKKQSRLDKNKWAFYTFNETSDEFPTLAYYMWKKGKAPKIQK